MHSKNTQHDDAIWCEAHNWQSIANFNNLKPAHAAYAQHAMALSRRDDFKACARRNNLPIKAWVGIHGSRHTHTHTGTTAYLNPNQNAYIKRVPARVPEMKMSPKTPKITDLAQCAAAFRTHTHTHAHTQRHVCVCVWDIYLYSPAKCRAAARARIYIHLISRHKTVVKCCKWNSNTHTHWQTHTHTDRHTWRTDSETTHKKEPRLLGHPPSRASSSSSTVCGTEKINVCRFAGRLCLFCHFWRLISQKKKRKRTQPQFMCVCFIVCLSLRSLSVPLSASAYYVNTKSIYWLSASQEKCV